MTQITGASGSGVVHVNARQRFDVSSMSDTRIYYIARDDQKAFTVEYDGLTIVQNDVVAQLKNTSSDQNLVIADVSFSSAVAQKFEMFFCTGTAAAGETVTPTNTHSQGGVPSEIAAMAGDTTITGLVAAERITSVRVLAGTSKSRYLYDSIIIAPGAQIMVQCTGATGGEVDVSFLCHLESVKNP